MTDLVMFISKKVIGVMFLGKGLYVSNKYYISKYPERLSISEEIQSTGSGIFLGFNPFIKYLPAV